jgi:glycosyltransferase involved in cell wall biosynthesis
MSIAAPSKISPSPVAPQRQRKRILVGAYAVSPARGSEPGVGWQICSRLAKFHDVTVLCSPGVPGPDANCSRDEIAQHIARHGPVDGLTLKFIEPPPLSWLFQRETTLCRRTLYYTGAAAWQRAAYAVANEIHRNQPFDLVHHLNITGYREPGYLWKINAPFVWGPIGGASNLPRKYFDLLSKKERLFYAIRNWTNGFQKSGARCRAAANRADHIWAISDADAQMVRDQWGHPVQQMLETGAVQREQGSVRNYDAHRPLKIIWSGKHIGRKALPILLHAIASLKDRSTVQLTVVGEGPETGHWKSLADSLGLNGIHWTGHVSQETALNEMSRSDLLAFTSVLEGTPHVVLEALSLGLPIICHNACGMGIAVTDDCGIRIPLQDSAASILGFAAAITRLAASPAELTRLSQAALRRAADLSWDSKVDQMLEVYDQLLAQHAHR